LPNTNRFRTTYLSYLSSPASDRPIYRSVCRRQAGRILELGIGVGQRAVRMIEAAGCFRPEHEISYYGLDPFEGRSAVDGPGVTLMMAHRLLKTTGARIQLVPGAPCQNLARTANSLGQFDVIVLSSRLDSKQLAEVWFYVPRLLHERSDVFLECVLPGRKTAVRLLSRAEIEAMASDADLRRAA